MKVANMDSISGIIQPGDWITGRDRDLVFQEQTIISYICDALNEAFISENEYTRLFNKEHQLNFEKCLSNNEKYKKQIYAKSFIYNLDIINKLFNTLDDKVGNENEKHLLHERYKSCFGDLKHIRDSLMHLEDRGIGKDKNKKPLVATVIVIGGFINNCYSYSGSDGKHYQIEISETTINKAKTIIQNLINTYEWE